MYPVDKLSKIIIETYLLHGFIFEMYLSSVMIAGVINKLIRNKKISHALVSLLIKPLEMFPGLCTDLHVICKKL